MLRHHPQGPTKHPRMSIDDEISQKVPHLKCKTNIQI